MIKTDIETEKQDSPKTESPKNANAATMPKANLASATKADIETKKQDLLETESLKSANAVAMSQANLAPGFGGGMMLMSRPGNLPVYSHKATIKADTETERQDRQRQNLPKVLIQEQCLYFLGKRHQRKQLMEEK